MAVSTRFIYNMLRSTGYQVHQGWNPQLGAHGFTLMGRAQGGLVTSTIHFSPEELDRFDNYYFACICNNLLADLERKMHESTQ